MLRGQKKKKKKEIITPSSRPVRILEEIPRPEIKANVKLKGQALVDQNLGKPR